MGIMHKNTTAANLGTPTAATEYLVYSTPNVQTGQGDGAVGIAGTLYFTAGTGATAVTLRLRQGGLAGTLVQALPAITVAAGSSYALSFGFTDTTAFTEQAGGGSYTLTAQQTAGTGAGTDNALDIEVIT